MPSSNQHNEQAAPIPDPNPKLTDKYGENPARYLVENVRVDTGHGTMGELIFARIRGIESIALCRFWKAIERRLARQTDRDPRDDVIEALEEREQYLKKHGEGPAQAGLTPAERRERATERSSESVAVLLDEDGNEVSWSRQQTAAAHAGVTK